MLNLKQSFSASNNNNKKTLLPNIHEDLVIERIIKNRPNFNKDLY